MQNILLINTSRTTWQFASGCSHQKKKNKEKEKQKKKRELKSHNYTPDVCPNCEPAFPGILLKGGL